MNDTGRMQSDKTISHKKPIKGILRNALFSTFVAVILCLGIGYKVTDLCNVLPEWADNGKRSYLEGKNLQKLPTLSPSAFIEGDLQDDIESYLAGLFPARDQALLANSAIQGTLIEISNAPFGFDVWPTNFSSSTLKCASTEILYAKPGLATKSRAASLERTATAINELKSPIPMFR